MFDEQAVTFLALLERKTLGNRANWLRYPKAYPYENNHFLQLHLSGKGVGINPTCSYFMPCKNGAIFLFTYADSDTSKEICVQENLGVPLLALQSGPTTDRIAAAIRNYLEEVEAQPDSVLNFFDAAVEGETPISEEEHMNLSY